MSHAVSVTLLGSAVACVVANALIVAADFARVPFVLANASEVGLRPTVLPFLAALKAAGAGGVVVGLAGLTHLGVVAATGLVLFYLGAVGAHVRASVYHNIAFPVLFLTLAVGTLTYFVRVL